MLHKVKYFAARIARTACGIYVESEKITSEKITAFAAKVGVERRSRLKFRARTAEGHSYEQNKRDRIPELGRG